ncbi:MliC family protein [Aquamicrobium sp. NLF2-7]|uniref:MliC family protein n=1 Tax=Aquamicrobium sp. NLF2-7 TaxID=2918753 RepID=UPI001EFB468E|nr:MliC family protein [Aquamicrobium sp. NLF2-7]MCG8270308.1 MliC family protein [Aquamicrobium sp. NLF2-7]
MHHLRLIAAAGLVACVVSAPAHAQQAQPHITLPLEASGEASVNTVTYTCGSETLSVSYVNADPNFLAILPVEGKSTVFASVIAASGARYAAGQYEWWSKGDDATLRDLTAGEDAKPLLECTSASE